MWDGKTYEYIAGAISVKEAIAVRLYTGKGYKDWLTGCGQMDPECLQALLWVIKAHNGEPCVMADIDFSIPEFVAAYEKAFVADRVEVETAPKARSGARKNRDSTAT